MTRSRSIEVGFGAVALMRASVLVLAPPPGAVIPTTLHKGPVPLCKGTGPLSRVAQRRAPDLAGRRARQLVGELDDAGVLVRRGLGLDVVLELAGERFGGLGAVLED